MKRDAATAELSREELEAEVAALRSENAQLRTAPLPPLNPLPPLAPLPAFDPLASPPASPAVLGANWGGGVAPVPVPASQSPLSPAPALSPGARVRVHGIVAKPELNGQRGVVTGFDASSGRCSVQLEDGRGPYKIKPENLEVVKEMNMGSTTKQKEKKKKKKKKES